MESGGTPGATSRSTGASTAQDRIAEHQHAQEVLRARSIVLVAAALWLLAGAPLDLFLAHEGLAGPVWYLMAVRLGASAYHAIALAVLFRTPPPPRHVADPLVLGVFPVTAAALAVNSLRVGGPASPYHAAILLVLLVQALVSSKHWRRGAIETTATAAVLPITFAIAYPLDAPTRAAFRDPHQLTYFATTLVLLACGVVIITWGGHILWSLRRSVFESRNLGRYRLLRRIGKGGMGEVWRAHDRATRRDVALKILSPEHGRTPAAIARFEREIEATASLTHPNTVRIYDWGVTADGVWYYAMELLDGVDARSLVRARGPLPPAIAVGWIAQAARAIAEAHRKGICHRDLTPGNLFVVARDGEADQVKVLDFGVARTIGPELEGLTVSGAVLGTPGYIAPEVAAGASATPASDVYGLGAALYFMLTGKSPRDAAKAAGSPPPPSELREGVPAVVDDVVVRALDAVPDRRYLDAGELATALAETGLAEPGGPRLSLESVPPAHGVDDTVDAALEATSAEAPRGKMRA
ncbi:MAG TPA: serine/threonine-protein kinase [Kofleriaceae bacterium]|nr:serine/threonine-protein kinase [Kofleriaceae bacterium]